MRTLLKKNMGAHKQRNYLTSIIYALTLGCIIFLLVTANLEIQSISASSEVANADIFLNTHGAEIDATFIDPILRKYSESIKDYGYVSAAVDAYQNSKAGVTWSDLANLKKQGVPTAAL